MNKLKVLYVASEAAPFIATGGLGEVAGSLPKALKEKYADKIDIRVVIPLYQSIWDRSDFEFLGKTSVPLGWRQQYCGVFKKILKNGVKLIFHPTPLHSQKPGCQGKIDQNT